MPTSLIVFHDNDERYPMAFGPGWRGPCTVLMVGWVLDSASSRRGWIVAGLSGMHTAFPAGEASIDDAMMIAFRLNRSPHQH